MKVNKEVFSVLLDPYAGLYPAFSMPPFTYMQIQMPNHYQKGSTKQEYYEPEAYRQAPPYKVK